MKSFAFLCVLVFCACGPADGEKADAGADGELCVDNETRCDGNSYQNCNDGSWVTAEQCLRVCDNSLGCVECNPSRNYCSGNEVHSCSASGQPAGLVETCEESLHCDDGECVDLCAQAVESRSYLGCEYWAVDLDNAIEIAGAPDVLGCLLFQLTTPGVKLIEDKKVCVTGNAVQGECDGDGSCPMGATCETRDVCGLDAEGSPFAVVVSNPQAFEVEVTVDNGSMQMMVAVPAGQVATIYPQDNGFADQSVSGSGVTPTAYRLTSNAPVVAYQFNPLDNVDVFSNDGSLLIPRHAFDTKYYAMTWASLGRRDSGQKDFNGYVTVVAWQDGTEVSVTPSANVRAGASEANLPAGMTRSYTLNAYEVLNLEAVADGDLTGSLVEVTGPADATVGVLAGHEAVAILHEGASCCADHIEEMMFPTSTWGTEYAVARSQARSDESDVLRILAQADDTTVTLNPPGSTSCSSLAAGEFCEIEISGDIEITATQPVLVAHYLKSVISLLGGKGDPSLALAVPVEQYRSTYTFLVPMEYSEQYISVVAHMGANVTLDGEDITSQLTAFGSTGKGAARIAVNPGSHNLNCDGGCGLEVYGYSDAVSYLFAGGLDLEQIVIE